MSYLGSWKIDDNLTFPANTHTPATGAATDADAVPNYRVYEDETGTAILTGSMAKLDDANTTGFYSEQIALTAANGFEKGKCYTIYISAAVGGVTGTISHTFQIEAEVDSNTNSGQVALQDDAITSAKYDESTAFPVASADTGATQIARVGADGDTLETISDEIAAVKSDTTAILTDTGTDGVALASATLNSIADAVLKRGISNVEDSCDDRSLTWAMAKLVNKIAAASGTLTVKKSDDSTTLFTQTITSDADANPITGLDTA